MKPLVLILSFVLASCAGGDKPKPAADETKEEASGFEYNRDTLIYELVWSDEFDYQGQPDPAKWSCETGWHGWGNNELQYYTGGANVRVQDGRMIIEARHEQTGGRDVTSTRIITKNKGDWLYGKLEVAAKLPRGLGTWPVDQRFHLLINLAFGGNWGGAQGLDYGALPARMEIDSVRVYQSREITALGKGR